MKSKNIRIRTYFVIPNVFRRVPDIQSTIPSVHLESVATCVPWNENPEMVNVNFGYVLPQR